ncbi:MAG: hypothetical protein RQ750_12940, partial [Roseovarius sp.]|nr:hypothetical protein [Roseovarius sp.]
SGKGNQIAQKRDGIGKHGAHGGHPWRFGNYRNCATVLTTAKPVKPFGCNFPAMLSLKAKWNLGCAPLSCGWVCEFSLTPLDI